jgi:ferredoxin
MPYVVTSDCIQCGACVAGCESNAITDGDTQSNIDVTICIECGTCKLNCPSDAIIYVEEGEAVKQPSDRDSVTAE